MTLPSSIAWVQRWTDLSQVFQGERGKLQRWIFRFGGLNGGVADGTSKLCKSLLWFSRFLYHCFIDLFIRVVCLFVFGYLGL